MQLSLGTALKVIGVISTLLAPACAFVISDARAKVVTETQLSTFRAEVNEVKQARKEDSDRIRTIELDVREIKTLLVDRNKRNN